MAGRYSAARRRQWRTAFIVDPAPGEMPSVVEWYAESLADEAADPGYDATAYPSFGPAGRTLRPEWTRRLEALRVLDRR